METVKIIALAFALAFLSESLVEYLFGSFCDHFPALEKIKWLAMYISAAVGVGVAFWYHLDLLALIVEDGSTWVGILLSGLVIGRGANFLHQFVSQYMPKPLKALPFDR